MNGVGYNNAPKAANDVMTIIGSSFEDLDGKGFLPLNALTSPDGIETYDQVQLSYIDDMGVTRLHTYEYDEYDGWLDIEDNYRVLEPDEALVPAGKGFWVLLQNEESTFTEVGPLAE